MTRGCHCERAQRSETIFSIRTRLSPHKIASFPKNQEIRNDNYATVIANNEGVKQSLTSVQPFPRRDCFVSKKTENS